MIVWQSYGQISDTNLSNDKDIIQIWEQNKKLKEMVIAYRELIIEKDSVIKQKEKEIILLNAYSELSDSTIVLKEKEVIGVKKEGEINLKLNDIWWSKKRLSLGVGLGYGLVFRKEPEFLPSINIVISYKLFGL